MSDSFTRACGVYRNAGRLGARPLPLAFGEVATYRRPILPRLIRAALELAALAGGLGGFVLVLTVLREIAR